MKDIIKDVIMDPKNGEERGMNWTYYLLRRNGGLLWPAAYAILLWKSWSILEDGWKIGFSIWLAIGMVVMFVCLLLGKLYFSELTRKADEAGSKVNLSFETLADKFSLLFYSLNHGQALNDKEKLMMEESAEAVKKMRADLRLEGHRAKLRHDTEKEWS